MKKRVVLVSMFVFFGVIKGFSQVAENPKSGGSTLVKDSTKSNTSQLAQSAGVVPNPAYSQMAQSAGTVPNPAYSQMAQSAGTVPLVPLNKEKENTNSTPTKQK
jgi:hypothetical protein